MATQLTDLEVDRVDAVDRPATRRKFLILKAEGDDTAAAAGEAKALLTAATKAMSTLRKAEGIALPGDVVDAMNELIDAVGDATITKFEKAADKPAEPPATPATKADAPAVPAIDADALATKIAKGIVEGLRTAALEDAGAEGVGPIARTAPASAQPSGQEAVQKSAGPRKMGDGLFSNIVYGRNS